MERLTVKDCDGQAHAKKVGYYDIIEKLAHYEELEEKRLLLKLPCKIGDDVYIIPSKVNFDLNVISGHEENNRVYHQKVANIVFTPRGWYIKCDKDMEYGTGNILVDIFFKQTWFLSEEEAKKTLTEMKGE